MKWREIHRLSSLPYNQGERFLSRRNHCFCDTQEPRTINCLKKRSCVEDFLVLNEDTFSAVKSDGTYHLNIYHTKKGILTGFKSWKLLDIDLANRCEVFVCKCEQVLVLGRNVLHDKKMERCCHCHKFKDSKDVE